MAVQQYIGYDNAVTIANVSAGSEQSGFPVSNVANPATNLVWKSDSVAANQYLTITPGGERYCDYVGIAGHNLGTALCDTEIQRQSSDGGSWLIACPEFGSASWDFNHTDYLRDAVSFEETDDISVRGGKLWKMIDNASVVYHQFRRQFTGGLTQTASMVAKAGTLNRCILMWDNATDGSRSLTRFDLLNGVVLSGPGTIEDMDNSEYLISVTATSTVDDTLVCRLELDSGSQYYAGAGDSIYISDLAVDLGSSIKGYAPVKRNNLPIVKTFGGSDYHALRIKLSPRAGINPRIAVVYTGRITQMERDIYVGHTPVSYGRKVDAINRLSESGQFLGRVIKATNYQSKISLENITKQWYRSTFEPFVQAAKTTPFFYNWRMQDYGWETGYCWATGGVPVPQNTGPNGMMAVSFDINGLA